MTDARARHPWGVVMRVLGSPHPEATAMTEGMARHPGSWPGPVVLQRAAGVQTGAVSESTELSFELNGTPVEVPDRFLGASLLEVLRDVGGITSATLFEKWHGMRTDPVTGGIVQYAIGFAVLLPVAATTETMIIDWTPGFAVSIAYLVIANSIISISLFIALVQRGDATRISAMMYLVPPLAMVAAWLILGETITPLALLGFALSAAGVYIVGKKTASG